MPFTRILFIFILLMFQAALGASPTPFDVDKANKRFDQINIKLSTQNLNTKDLESAISELEALQAKAKACVEENENQLKLISEAAVNHYDLNKKEGDKSKYLNNEQQNYHSNLVRCKLFVLRTKDSIAAFKETISKVNTSALLDTRATLWMLFSLNPLHSLSQVNMQTMAEYSGITALSQATGYTLLGSLLVGLIISFAFFNLLKRHDNKISNVLSKFIIPIMLFGVASLFFWLTDRNKEANTIFELGFYAIFLFNLFLCVTYYIYGSYNEHKNMYQRIVALASFVLFGYLVQVIFTQQSLSASLFDLASITYLVVLNALAVWLLWPHEYRFKAYGVRMLLRSALIIFFIANTLITCFGYLSLSYFLVAGLLLTTLLCAATYIVTATINKFAHDIQSRKLVYAQKILDNLTIKRNRNFPELILIQLALYLMILSGFILSLFKIWHLPENYIYNMEVVFVDGFNFSSVSVSLLSIIYALLIFAFLNILGRAISTRISKKHHFSGEQDTQSAIASIVTYISFCVALVASLLVLGINFTGLAIIIGALSVGIGLGLQTIVNNFVSGLILLIEKPIKSGDRILVNGIEGFVRKVRIRSTQIMTLSKEDVMIPNSDLVTSPVTNYMFRNNIWRVTVKVGVAYGSDVDLVKQTLMEVALGQELVMKDAPHEPIILFKEFGDSSLLFELWCVIPDVNKKFYVTSELHFRIDEAFRQRQITIAFPQRDVHIKTSSAVTPEKHSLV